MAINFKCPKCRRVVAADDIAADTQFPCPLCGAVMREISATEAAADKVQKRRLSQRWMLAVIVFFGLIALGYFAWYECQLQRAVSAEAADAGLPVDVYQRTAAMALIPAIRQRTHEWSSDHAEALRTTASTIIQGPAEMKQRSTEMVDKSRMALMGLARASRGLETGDYRNLRFSQLSKLPLKEGGYQVLLQVDLVQPSSDPGEATIGRRFFVKFHCAPTAQGWNLSDVSLDRNEPLGVGDW
jgi:predicted RNA-binding Zn-ribbon protein involved in translation (DUF1610 family)